MIIKLDKGGFPMVKRTILMVFFIIACMSACALAAPVQKQTLTGKVNPDTAEDIGSNIPVMCNQLYGLCNTAICSPMESDPTKAICTCPVEDGVSMGGDSCQKRIPTGMFLNEEGKWMIKAGVPVGQIESSYSFLYAAPTKKGEINPNTTPEDYTGERYVRSCVGGAFADCYDSPCFVPSADPLADVTTDRLAADYAICECGIRTNIANYVIIGPVDPSCSNETICQDYLWSAGVKAYMAPGSISLAKYLKDHPEEDPEQAYILSNCPDCQPCAEWAEVNMTELE